jgi:hypothetical protein
VWEGGREKGMGREMVTSCKLLENRNTIRRWSENHKYKIKYNQGVHQT